MLVKLKCLLPSLLTLKQEIALSLFLNLSLIFLLRSPSSQTYAATTTYYVAPNGSDANPGTVNKPWQHISYAADNSIVKPGDTIYIRGGIYNESINQKVSGVPGKFVTYRNYPGEKPIISDVNANASWRWLIKDQSYVRIEGLTVQDYRKGAIQIRTYASDLSHVEIINNTFLSQRDDNGDTRKTIHVSTLDSGHYLYDVTIADNYFQNMNTGVKPMLQVEGDVRGARIMNNIIVGTSNIAINIAGRPTIGQPERILIKENSVSEYGLLGGPTAGIYLDGAGKYIVIEENVVHDGRIGIKANIESEATALVTQFVIIRRNVLYNNATINLKLGAGNISNNCAQFGTLQRSVAVHNTVFTQLETTNNDFGCGVHLRWINNSFIHLGESGYQFRLGNATVQTSTWQSDYNAFYSGDRSDLFSWLGQTYNTLSEFRIVSGFEQHSDIVIPLFVDIQQYDFHLSAESPLRDAGGPFTLTSSAGYGQLISVQDASYFSDGLGLQPGDSIRVGTNAPINILEIDYEKDLISVDQVISWSKDSPVSYDYSGNASDIGAFEYSPQLTLFSIPQDKAVLLSWEVDDGLPAGTHWRIRYGPASSPNTVLVEPLSHSTRSYKISGLSNYVTYNVTLDAITDNEPILSTTISVMPTDIIIFLPNIQMSN